MIISESNFIYEVIKKWNVNPNYLPSTLKINYKNEEIKYDFIYKMSFKKISNEEEVEDRILKKILDLITNDENVVNCNGELIVKDKKINSIVLYVYKKEDYFSRKKSSAIKEILARVKKSSN